MQPFYRGDRVRFMGTFVRTGRYQVVSEWMDGGEQGTVKSCNWWGHDGTWHVWMCIDGENVFGFPEVTCKYVHGPSDDFELLMRKTELPPLQAYINGLQLGNVSDHAWHLVGNAIDGNSFKTWKEFGQEQSERGDRAAEEAIEVSVWLEEAAVEMEPLVNQETDNILRRVYKTLRKGERKLRDEDSDSEIGDLDDSEMEGTQSTAVPETPLQEFE